VRLGPQCPFLGRNLADLGLTELTGTTLLGLVRAGQPMAPAADLTLQAGDLLALAGSPAALDTASRLLGAGPSAEA
jgi:K+/H+ antiporter YhaU regulatory subunit KhtT